MIKNTQLGYYLAGFIEGDGNIWTPKISDSSTKYTFNPRIEIAFHKKDLPFFENLKVVLGTGCIYQRKFGYGCNYSISKISKIIEIIYLINGKFRTPKIIYLYKAIDYINLKYNLSIDKLPLDCSDLNSNPWLSGITDADGNFILSILKNATKYRLICIFSIKQRLIDKPTGKSCLPFMTEIADLFQCNINNKSENIIGFFAKANTKQFLTFNYFDKYPLMTAKYLDYLCFKKALNYLGKPLTEEFVLELWRLKDTMNSKRSDYDWNHLKNFYKYLKGQ